MPEPRFAYPVVLDLHDVPVLVVGAGAVASRKVDGLAAAGAIVRVVAPDVGADLDQNRVGDLRVRPFEPADLDGVQLVITATGVPEVDATVADLAHDRGIWVNAADQPADCTFILPAVARTGRVSVAVSTDGASPALAGYLRDRCAAVLDDRVADLAERLATERAELRTAGRSTEGLDWRSRIERELAPDS